MKGVCKQQCVFCFESKEDYWELHKESYGGRELMKSVKYSPICDIHILQFINFINKHHENNNKVQKYFSLLGSYKIKEREINKIKKESEEFFKEFVYYLKNENKIDTNNYCKCRKCHKVDPIHSAKVKEAWKRRKAKMIKKEVGE